MSAFDLAIETSTPIGSVALGSSSGLLGEITLGASVKHAEALLPAVQQLLKSCSARPSVLARIVVGGVPGSFTGLRIAAATAKEWCMPSMCRSSRIPDCLRAASTGLRDQPVCALFDARRSEVYAACYRVGEEIATLLEPSVLHLDELMNALAPHSVVFAGEGALKHEDSLREHGGIVLPAAAGVPRASTLLSLASQYPQLGRVQDAARWEPDYLRPSSAERGISA
jgi:tRNA threonylcarbamoyladenosine biosynthesis protein TsaB